MKPEYIDFLIAEYKKAGLKPEVVVVDHKRYIIPCWYVQNCAAPLKSFLTDFFDFMRKDYVLYRRYKRKVRYIVWFDGNKNRRLIVPFAYRNATISTSEIAEKIFSKAAKKYKKAVMTASELAKIYPDMIFNNMLNTKSITEMIQALKTWQIKQHRNMAVYITGKIGNFLSKNPMYCYNKVKLISIGLLRQKAKKWALKTVLSAAVATSVFEAIKSSSS